MKAQPAGMQTEGLGGEVINSKRKLNSRQVNHNDTHLILSPILQCSFDNLKIN